MFWGLYRGHTDLGNYPIMPRSPSKVYNSELSSLEVEITFTERPKPVTLLDFP